jgi:acetylornithine/succinyldiaminopimelate/putrescine aminotransferase
MGAAGDNVARMAPPLIITKIMCVKLSARSTRRSASCSLSS